MASSSRSLSQRIGLWLGPIVCVLMVLTADTQSTMGADAWMVAGVGIWMATGGLPKRFQCPLPPFCL